MRENDYSGSKNNNALQTHLQHTSPGSTHKVSSLGRLRSEYWTSLSWQARSNTGSFWNWFTLMHLEREKNKIKLYMLFSLHYSNSVLVILSQIQFLCQIHSHQIIVNVFEQQIILRYNTTWYNYYLNAWPWLGFSGYQCPLNFSCSPATSLSTTFRSEERRVGKECRL